MESKTEQRPGQTLSRRDFLKLTAALTGGIGLLAVPQARVKALESAASQNEKMPFNPISLSNQIYLNGHLLSPQEILRARPGTALDEGLYKVNNTTYTKKVSGPWDWLLHNETTETVNLAGEHNDLIVDVFTENQDVVDSPLKAVRILVPNYNKKNELEDYGMFVEFADGRHFHCQRVRTEDPRDGGGYQEVFYDPGSNSIFQIKKTHTENGRKRITDQVAPTGYDSEKQHNKIISTDMRAHEVGDSYLEISKLKFNEANEWHPEPVILPGSAWFNRLKEILAKTDVDTIEQATQIALSSKMDQNKPTLNEQDEVSSFLNTTLYPDHTEISKAVWNYIQITQNDRTRYNEPTKKEITDLEVVGITSRGKTLPKPAEDIAEALFSMKKIFDLSPKLMKDLTPAEHVKLFELLCFKKYFVADFNFTSDVLKHVLVGSLMPNDLIDDFGALFFRPEDAGRLNFYNLNKIDKIIEENFQNRINAKTRKKIKGDLNKLLKDFYKNVFPGIKEIPFVTPRLIGLTEIHRDKSGNVITRYRLVQYNPTDKKTAEVFSIDSDQVDENILANNNGDFFKTFDTEQFQIEGEPEQIALQLLNLRIDPHFIKKDDEGNVIEETIVTKAVSLVPKRYSRRPYDFKTGNTHDLGVPYHQIEDVYGIKNREILFFQQNIVQKFLSWLGNNSKEEQPESGEWITEIKNKRGPQIFSDDMFGGLQGLLEKITKSSVTSIEVGANDKKPTINSCGDFVKEDGFLNRELFERMTRIDTIAVATDKITVQLANLKGNHLKYLGFDPKTQVIPRIEMTNISYPIPLNPGDYVSIKSFALDPDGKPYVIVAYVTPGLEDQIMREGQVFVVSPESLLVESAITAQQKAAILAGVLALEYVTMIGVPPGTGVGFRAMKGILNGLINVIGAVIGA